MQNIQPWVAPGEVVTIVSFDLIADAASREAQEDRSLNLALRRRRVRSEILRIPLQAEAAAKAFLTDLVSALTERRLLIVTRALPEYPEAAELIAHLCDLAAEAVVIVIGDGKECIAHVAATTYTIVSDDRAQIEMLADALMIREAG